MSCHQLAHVTVSPHIAIFLNLFEEHLDYYKTLDRYFAAKTAYEDYRCGRVESRLLCRMAPETDELRKVYDILRSTACFTKAEMLSDRAGINACKFRIILDVFAEFGLAETDITRDSVKLLPAKGKADLEKSRVMAGLKNT